MPDLRNALQMEGASISSGNSTTSALGISATYTGTGESSLGFGSVTVAVFANVASAVDGLAVEQSQDNTNWDVADYVDVVAGQAISFSVNLVAEFYRVVYVNGGTAQTTFRLETKRNPRSFDFPAGGRSDAPSKFAIATLTTTGDAAIIAAPGADKSLSLRSTMVSNTSATLTRVDVKDSTTIFVQGAAAASGGGFVYQFKTPKLLAENVALNGALGTAVTDVRVTAEYVVVKS